MNRKPNAQPIKPMDFFTDAPVSDDDEELSPGIRPASEILAELRRAADASHGRI